MIYLFRIGCDNMKCLACGAEIEFSPKDKNLKCSYCGTVFDAKEYKEKITTAKEVTDKTNNEKIETKSYSCKQCGAKLLTFDDTAITFCSYCGSSNVIESELYKSEAPEYVIPFKISKEECENIYKKEIKKHIFAPKEMMDDVVIKKFRGIYMPYCVYKAVHSGECVNHGDKYSHHSGNYDYYNVYNIIANINAEYEGMSYDLSSSFYDKFSQAIGPFDFKEAEKFNISYLSGFYADSRDVRKELYSNDAIEMIADDTSNELMKYKQFRKYGCADPKIPYTIQDEKIAYYPVYFLAIRNKKNDAVNYAVINGQTGKIAVELPIDIKKYLIFMLVLAIPIFVVFYSLFTITPQILLVLSAILGVISSIIIIEQGHRLSDRYNHADDKGFNEAKQRFEEKGGKRKKKKIKYNINIFSKLGCIISVFLPIITLILNPISDSYYYVTGLISLCIILYLFKDIISQHNDLTSKKLSQIGIRGGDESEI